MFAAARRFAPMLAVGSILVGGSTAATGQQPEAVEEPGVKIEFLENGGFERADSSGSPIGWRAEGLLIPGVIVGTVKSASGRPGTKALRLRSETSPASIWCFNGPFDVSSAAGRELEVSCFYRTKDLPGGHIDLVTYGVPFAEDGWETTHLTTEQHALDDTRKWRLFSWRMRCPEAAVEAILLFGATGAGEIQIDDVSVRPASAAVRMEAAVLGELVGWPSRREVRLRVVNETREQKTLEVNLTTWTHRPGPKRTVTVRVPAGGDEDVGITYDMPTNDPHRIEISLDDAAEPAIYDTLVGDVPALLTGRIVQPNFRGTLLSSIPTEEIIVEGRIAASKAICADLTLEAELGGAGRIARDGQGITRPDGPTSWRLVTPRKGMLTGHYKLILTAHRQGKIVGKLPLGLSRAPAHDVEVAPDAEGRLLVNGKRTFVNGLYNVTQATDLDRAAAHGFNVVVVPAGSAGPAFMQRARDLDLMMIIYSPITPEQVSGPSPSFWEHTVAKYGRVPGVIGWHLQGKPDAALVRLDVFAQHQAEMAKIDIYHPTITLLSVMSLVPDYARWSDIIAVEPQPVPALPVSSVASDVAYTRRMARPGQPVWAAIQSVGRAWLVRGGGLEKGVSGRPPTGAEHRAMTFLAVIHGAQGILHHGYFFNATKDRDAYLIPRDAPDLWEGMKGTNTLISKLLDVLAEGQYRGSEITGPIHVGAWEHDGQLHVVAVNTQPSAALTTFSVPGSAPPRLLRLDDRSEVFKTDGGQFADDLPAYGARIYIAPLASGDTETPAPPG